MCGITGFIDPKREGSRAELEHVVSAMAEVMYHRGPDDGGCFADEKLGLALGFRRLAIQDLSRAGAQPMLSASGRYIIVFNGEIYNFRELRRELELDGYGNWRGHSDTEVLLALVERRGIKDALVKIDGMFAFAIYDKERQRLHLARDRMGEKPLYYGWAGGVFAFGSELKAIVERPGWRREVEPAALHAYMRYSYVPAPLTIYRGIRKLLPGHLLTVDLEILSERILPAVEAYWNSRSIIEDAKRNQFAGDEPEAIDQLDKLLTHSVSRRLISDVPLGVFLSGGIDSSTVAAIAQKVSLNPIKTFTIGFGDARYDESKHAAAVAAHLGTDHFELLAEKESPLRLVEHMPCVYDEPFADVSQLPTLLLSELTRRHVTVALSGDGGDELFLGYPRYVRATERWAKSQGLFAYTLGRMSMVSALFPNTLWKKVSVGRRPWRLGDKLYRMAADGAATTPEDVYEAYVSRWRTAERPTPEPTAGYYFEALRHPHLEESLDRMSFADAVTYLPDDLLVKIDRATMSVGLEGRTPLLDHKVVQFAWSLPSSMKIKNGIVKYPLRGVLAKYLTGGFFDKPKQGFEPPLGDWLRGPLRDWANELLEEKNLGDGGNIDPVPVRDAWREHLDGVRDWRFELWNVLMFQAWRKAWRV
ncbi:MAG: Asparagine synthetase [glutamine-hydrolyzing] 1 [Alphaproteobacteria bacterium MarineAlpha4_Bin2]|nr:MAG: Asparagine synthetase [glutamine-hydrolyzing] 1 [Alphaproteobacteria bacterium MarineAlpha4_Bin2]